MVVKHKENKNLELVKTKYIDENCLALECKHKNTPFDLMVTYWSCDYKENEKLVTEIELYVGEARENDKRLILIGDFNSHLNFIEDNRNTDKNGQYLLRLIEENNLTLLNSLPECTGKYTWEGRSTKSVIDYALMNNKMLQMLVEMKIDEQKSKYDLSDHNLIKISLNIETKSSLYENITNEIDYYVNSKLCPPK